MKLARRLGLKMAKFKVEGLRELERALAELPKATAKNTLKRTLKLAAQPIADEAQRLAPENFGTLKRSIVVTTKKPPNHDPGKKAFSKAKRAGASNAEAAGALRAARRVAPGVFAEAFVGVLQKVRQAIPQEFGTDKHPAQPFMRPAWDSKKMDALDIIKSELGNQITKAAERLARKAARKAAKGA